MKGPPPSRRRGECFANAPFALQSSGRPSGTAVCLTSRDGGGFSRDVAVIIGGPTLPKRSLCFFETPRIYGSGVSRALSDFLSF